MISNTVSLFSTPPIKLNIHSFDPTKNNLQNVNSITKTTTDISENTMTLIKEIAGSPLKRSKTEGKEIQSTHPKNPQIFDGRKIHSLAFSDGTFFMFVKQQLKQDEPLKNGSFKDMQSAECFMLDTQKNVLYKLSDVARLRFKRDVQKINDTSQKEIELHLTLNNHPNIVKLISHMTYKVDKTVLYEKLYDMDLSSFIKRGCFQRSHIIPIIQQILLALEFMHTQKKIVYNDLKSNNIVIKMISENTLEVALTDFGLSVPLDQLNDTEIIGAFDFLSPEKCFQMNVVENKPLNDLDKLEFQIPINERIDIWGLGIILFEMMNVSSSTGQSSTNQSPPHSPFIRHLLTTNENFLDFMDFCGPISTCLQENARCLDTDIVKMMSTFQDTKNCLVERMTQLWESYTKLSSVSSNLKPLDVSAIDYQFCLNSHKLLSDINESIVKDIRYCISQPDILENPNYIKSYITTHWLIYHAFAISKIMIRRYFLTIDNASIPNPDQNPLEYLLHMLLQPNAAKRITKANALQVIAALEESKKRAVENEKLESFNKKMRFDSESNP